VNRLAVAAVGGTLVLLVLVVLLFVGLPRRDITSAGTPAASSTSSSPVAGRRIKARLFYVSDDGTRLQAIERDVPFGEGTVEQARHIVEAQLAPAVEPLVSAVPIGTALRALFVTDRGEAYVDLSREVASGHSGGSMNEVLTVYTVVDVLTENLPAVTSVQILVDGKQVSTLAGHVDLRRPLEKNLAWVQ